MRDPRYFVIPFLASFHDFEEKNPKKKKKIQIFFFFFLISDLTASLGIEIIFFILTL